MFKGAITALVTPFAKGKVDEKTFQALAEWQIKEGIHGLVPCGTTGESPTLSHEEHNRVVSLCVEAAGGQVPVIAGAGSNSTEEAIMMARHAKQAGADGILVAAPYYNKPSQEGLYQHYKAIHDAVAIPMVLYNIPGRSVVDISDETIARLAELPQVVGIKDATGNLLRICTLRAALKDKKPDFCLLSGDDGTALAYNAQGGTGCISVSANVIPRLVAQFQDLCLAGDFRKALPAHDALTLLHKAMFCEPSPAPVKYGLSLLGKCENSVRLPLVPLSPQGEKTVHHALHDLGLVA